MTFQVVNGLSFDQWTELPDGSRIVSADWGVQPDWSQQTQRAFRNHNIFRLDKNGNVLWQIKRDDIEGARLTTLALMTTAGLTAHGAALAMTAA